MYNCPSGLKATKGSVPGDLFYFYYSVTFNCIFKRKLTFLYVMIERICQDSEQQHWLHYALIGQSFQYLTTYAFTKQEAWPIISETLFNYKTTCKCMFFSFYKWGNRRMEISNLSKVAQFLSADASIWARVGGVGSLFSREFYSFHRCAMFSSSKDIRIRCSEHKTVRKWPPITIINRGCIITFRAD